MTDNIYRYRHSNSNSYSCERKYYYRYKRSKLPALFLTLMLACSLFLTGCGSSGEIAGRKIPFVSELISTLAGDSLDDHEADRDAGSDHADKDKDQDKGKDKKKDTGRPDYGLADPEGYLYLQLDKKERIIYDQILEACFGFGKEIALDSSDEEQIERIYYYVIADHPDIFWTEGYKLSKMSLAGKVISISFTPKLSMSEEEAGDWKKTIENKVKKFLKKAGTRTSDYGRIKYAFDYIVMHTDYEAGAEHNQNICSVFGKGKSVCQGYSAALQYLLQRQGIQAVTVNGEIKENGSSHAWNYVQADGKWYQIDVTWGDPAFSEGSSTAKIPKDLVVYTHFCVTDGQISKTHKLNSIFPMPACKASADNYYVHEKQYFKEKNDTRLGNAIKKALKRNKNWVSLRYADQKLYKSELKRLIDNHKIFDVMHKAGVGRNVNSISYIDSSSSLTLIVIWN